MKKIITFEDNTNSRPRREEDEGTWDIWEWYRKRNERQAEEVGRTATSNFVIVTMDAEREQIKKHSTRSEEQSVAESPAKNKKGEELKAELDDLLDEIDEVLEENAEEFVRDYVQKGGE